MTAVHRLKELAQRILDSDGAVDGCELARLVLEVLPYFRTPPPSDCVHEFIAIPMNRNIDITCTVPGGMRGRCRKCGYEP